jgi:hypothetical protein
MSPGNIRHCGPFSSSTMWLSECDRIFIAKFGVVAPTERSLLAWRLDVRVVGIGFIGFVMADNAAGRGAHFSVTGHVAGYAAHDSTFDAPFCMAPETDATEMAATQAVVRIHFIGCPPIPKEQSGQAKTVPADPSDYDSIEVGGYPTVREDPHRLGQY